MTRKLLPYEYQLIAQLGVTKEEYLEFLSIQETYSDIKAGTIFDTRGEVVSATIAVVGLIFSVVSTVLKPRPSISAPQGVSVGPTAAAPAEPQGVGGQTQTREQRFSPRFGFNNQQDLAKYGDPVNLIYADINTNPKGGVRAGTSLVWSAVRSFGSTQFVQLLLALGAGSIGSINTLKSAFGQTTIDDLVSQNKWLYFAPQSTGFLQWANETSPVPQYATDPTFYGNINNNPYRLQLTGENTRVDGFSQAYSPTSQNSFGLYGVVPINSLVYQRNDGGYKEVADLGLTATWNWKALQAVAVDFEMTVTIASTVPEVNDVQTQAQEIRRALASTFDDSGIFKLGSALFRVQSINTGSPDEGDMIVKFKCVEAGNAPSVNYDVTSLAGATEAFTQLITSTSEYINAKRIVDALETEDERIAYNITYTGGDPPYESQAVAYTADNIINGTNANATQQAGTYDGEGNFTPVSGPGIYKAQYSEQFDDNGNAVASFYGYTFSRFSTSIEKAAYTKLVELNTKIASYDPNVSYYTKALARVETASYQTVQPCHIVDLAIKSRVSMRVSGRQERYGRDNLPGYPVSDNGSKKRKALFLLKYKKAGGTFTYVPGIFAVSRAAETDNFNYLKFNSGLTLPAEAAYWQFKLEAVVDAEAEVAKHPELRTNRKGRIGVNFFYIDNSGETDTIGIPGTIATIQYTGKRRVSATGSPPVLGKNPTGLAQWALFNLDADNQLQFSFDGGPEFTLSCATEQQIQSFGDFPRLYNNISLVGLNLFSGRNLQDLRSFTAFVNQGRKVKKLRTLGSTDENSFKWDNPSFNFYPLDPDGPTCYAPDIFLDTVLDDGDGIGKYAKTEGIDIAQLARTKQFCIINKFFMDGIIADPTNWRGFWVEAAAFSLLEFARIGGRETLIPAVPYNYETGEMNRIVNVSALFNQGNIMEDSYKEEFIDYGANVRDLIASIVYRDTDEKGVFSINRTVEIRLKDTIEEDAVRETFYVSQFISTREQAIFYGKFLCNTRRYITKAIEFKTFPTQDPVSPGAFVYVDIGQNNWDGIRTGTIGPEGALNVPLDNNIPNGNYKFLLYRSGNGVVSVEAIVQDNMASTLAAYDGWLFVMGTATTTKRVFRITEVQMDEEGEITVRGTNYPCTTDGLSEIANFSDNSFTVLGALE